MFISPRKARGYIHEEERQALVPFNNAYEKIHANPIEMGSCTSKCKTDAPWKPFVTTTVRNVVVNTLVVEPSLYMVKECGCKKCVKVNKRQPNHEEALRYSSMLDDVKRAQSPEDINASKRKSMAIRT